MEPDSETSNFAVVVVVDQWGAALTNTYGNTCFETDQLNLLATQSLLFENVITPEAGLFEAYRSFTTSQWFARLQSAGIKCSLLTDDLALADHPIADAFDDVFTAPVQPATRSAETLEETELAQFFAQANDWLAKVDTRESGICWIHSRGLGAAWDAPYSIRQSFADEDDPAPPTFFETPECVFDEEPDPDQLLSFQQACVAQVAVLDNCLGALLQQLDEPKFASSILSFLSLRGFPLGEHRKIGGALSNGDCYAESVHVPMMLRIPPRTQTESVALVRSQSLVQPGQVLSAMEAFLVGDQERLSQILDQFAFSLPDQSREVAISHAGERTMIQTHAWKLIYEPTSDKVELYVKPDDRWEVNEVAKRCPQVVSQLKSILLEQEDGGPIVLAPELYNWE
ncbi:MAG: hypothetical protein AAFN77_15070 [Planctomycetota bacterium]